MAPIIKLLNNPRYRSKMAAFDFDSRLLLENQSVPAIVKKYYDTGNFIAIFMNEMPASNAEVVCEFTEARIPVAMCIGVKNEEMYDALVAMWPKKPQGWNLDKSVFIGNDRAFAVTVGFATVQTPEDAIQLNALNEATVDP